MMRLFRQYMIFFFSAMAVLLGQSAATQVQLPGGGAPGGGGGGDSWWGGIPINIGQNWHAEIFPDGMDSFVCWETDPAGEDVSYTLTYDWATAVWSKNGTQWDSGLAPG